MKKVLLIGNGASRQGVDLQSFVKDNDFYYTVGCNKIYKDFIPDRIVMWDASPVIDMCREDTPIFNRLFFYTLKILSREDRDECKHKNSGYYSFEYITKYMQTYIQTFNDPEYSIHMIGFDSFLSENDHPGSNCYSYGIYFSNGEKIRESHYSMHLGNASNDWNWSIAEQAEEIDALQNIVIHTNGRSLNSKFEKYKKIIADNSTLPILQPKRIDLAA